MTSTRDKQIAESRCRRRRELDECGIHRCLPIAGVKEQQVNAVKRPHTADSDNEGQKKRDSRQGHKTASEGEGVGRDSREDREVMVVPIAQTRPHEKLNELARGRAALVVGPSLKIAESDA